MRSILALPCSKIKNLIFCGQPDHSFATIESMEGKEVPIGLWEISARDEKSLDRYEGYPNFYHKTVLSAMLDGEEVHAMVYIMDLAMPAGLPSAMYYDIVEKGYRDCGLGSGVSSGGTKDQHGACVRPYAHAGDEPRNGDAVSTRRFPRESPRFALCPFFRGKWMRCRCRHRKTGVCRAFGSGKPE